MKLSALSFIAQQIEPLDVGQHQVHQDDIGLRCGHFLTGLLGGGGGFDQVAFRFEQQAEKFCAVGVILDYQHSGRH
jgi:hypothetical protein